MSFDSIIESIRQHPKLIIAEDYEISVRSTQSKTARWIDELPTDEHQDQCTQIRLRVLHRKRPGTATTQEIHPKALHRLVEEAFAAAELSREDPWFRFPMWKKAVPSLSVETQPLLKSEPLENPPGYFEENVGEYAGQSVIVRKTEKAVRRASFYGQRHAFQLPILVGNKTSVLKDEIWGPVSAAELLNRKRRLFAVGEWVLQGYEQVPKIEGSVIFSPHALAPVLQFISGWFCADRFQAGTSPLFPFRREDRWLQTFSAVISLSDDATSTHGDPHEPFDAEGSLCVVTDLVRDGIPISLLYDSFHAARDNRLSTANLWVEQGQPLARIRHSTLKVEPGKFPDDALQRELGGGFFIDAIVRFEAVSDRRFNATLLGWRIRDGRPEKFIVSPDVTIDALELLQSAAVVSDTLQYVGSIGAPSIVFEKIP